MSPPGGGNGVAAWMLQALASEHDVTMLTWWPMDVGLMNRFWGTSLRAGDFKAAGYAYMLAQWNLAYAGRFAESRAMGTRAEEALARDYDLRWHIWSVCASAVADMWQGRWSSSIQHARRALSIARQHLDDRRWTGGHADEYHPRVGVHERLVEQWYERYNLQRRQRYVPVRHHEPTKQPGHWSFNGQFGRCG